MAFAIHPFTLLALLVAAPALAQDASPPEPPKAPPKARMSAAECEVWARELSFSQSVADHDAAAFAEHLHAQAAFGSGRAVPTRSREAVAREWAGLIAGKPVTLSWYPTRTTIAGVGTVAASSGPALFEDLSPDAKSRYAMSQFHSIWHKDDDGAWRILFDDGTPPRPVTDAEAAAFKAGRPKECPRA
jgi:ketosteroid isomerase-like protein